MRILNKKRSFLLFFFILTTIFFCVTVFFIFIKPPIIIVNEVGQGGRLGDQLISYSKAKWLSYKYHIPCAIVPFKHYDELNTAQEKYYWGLRCFPARLLCKLFGHVINLKKEDDLALGLKTIHRPTRFVASIATQLHEKADLCTLVTEHKEFGNILKNMLQPIAFIKPLDLPKDKITVAVHVRKGGGYDPAPCAQQYESSQKNSTESKIGIDKEFPDKFPPEQFYVDQIKRLHTILGNLPLYVYIFTDDKNPEQLTQRIKEHVKEHVNDDTITFACKTGTYTYKTHVIEDFAGMTQCDCLIRSTSGFAYAAQLAGNFKIILHLEKIHWQDDNILHVDEVGTIIDKKGLKKRLEEKKLELK